MTDNVRELVVDPKTLDCLGVLHDTKDVYLILFQEKHLGVWDLTPEKGLAEILDRVPLNEKMDFCRVCKLIEFVAKHGITLKHEVYGVII